MTPINVTHCNTTVLKLYRHTYICDIHHHQCPSNYNQLVQVNHADSFSDESLWPTQIPRRPSARDRLQPQPRPQRHHFPLRSWSWRSRLIDHDQSPSALPQSGDGVGEGTRSSRSPRRPHHELPITKSKLNLLLRSSPFRIELACI